MPSRQSSSSSSSSSLFPQLLFCIFRLSTLSAASTNFTQRYGKVKRRERIHYKDCLHYSVWLARTSRLQEQPSLYLFSFTVIHSIHNTYTNPGTCLSNKNWERLLRRGAFALVFDTLFLSKKESLHPCVFLLRFYCSHPQLLTACWTILSICLRHHSSTLTGHNQWTLHLLKLLLSA